MSLVPERPKRAIEGLQMPSLFMQSLPKKMPSRIVVYVKDVENITGRKTRAARLLLQRIREQYQKPKNAFVSVKEFCRFTGFDEEDVKEFLLD